MPAGSQLDEGHPVLTTPTLVVCALPHIPRKFTINSRSLLDIPTRMQPNTKCNTQARSPGLRERSTHRGWGGPKIFPSSSPATPMVLPCRFGEQMQHNDQSTGYLIDCDSHWPTMVDFRVVVGAFREQQSK